VPTPFHTTRLVEFADTDMAGIMHFSNFFKWMEACEAAFYRSLDLPLVSFVPGQMIGWPRASASCQYQAPLRFNDIAEVKLYVKRLGNRSITYVFQFHKDSQLVAQGEMTAVCVTGDPHGAMVPQSIPADVRERVQQAPESAWASGA